MSSAPSLHAAHVTVVHPRYDTRILFKQCLSLARAGVCAVSLFVADGKGDEEYQGVRIRDMGQPAFGRLGRALVGSVAMWSAIRREKVNVVQLHDPELLVLGLLLRLGGMRVIFDMHENLPKEILTKSWVSRPLRRLLSVTVRTFQTLACRSIPTVFAETSYARDFPMAKSGVIVLNYPLVDALVSLTRPKRVRFTVGYIGGISCERGADVVLDALSQLRLSDPDFEAVFVGPVSSELAKIALWERVVAEGWLTATGRLKPEDGWSLMAECHVGVAVLRPSPNFVDSYPTKLFEYMALGLPVVVSDFPLWRSVVEDADCGFAVDPTDAAAVAQAVRWVRENPEKAREMGERGRQAVLRKYNWASEFRKLRALYEEVLAH